jgi:hypothetical protein
MVIDILIILFMVYFQLIFQKNYKYNSQDEQSIKNLIIVKTL